MKTNIRNDALYLSLDALNVCVSKIDAEQQKYINKKKTEFCMWASHFIMKHPFQDA